ncbi:MAG TPA: GNAT family N-acetyltransferase [Beijerinckiaceae bacterium]
MSRVSIRAAEKRDIPAISDMIVALRVEQEMPAPPLTRERLLRDAFPPRRRVSVVVADAEGQIAGYAMFQKFYEPVAGLEGIHLADIYVRPALRRRGLARALIQEVKRAARMRDAKFLWWVTAASNAAAIAFYKSLNASGTATISYGLPVS